MIELRGRWTAVQLRALLDAGWITAHEYFSVLDVTTCSDSCRWFIIVGFVVSGEEFRGH